MSRAFASLVFALSAVSLFSCGGGGSAACTDVAACGGNVIGNWTIVSSCVTGGGMSSAMVPGLGANCSGATLDSSHVSVSGTVALHSDGTFAQTLTFSGTAALTLPASCLTVGGVTLTCDQLNQALAGTQGGAAGSGGAPISCHAAGGGCACTTSVSSQNTTTTGTYATSGSLLSLTGGGGLQQYGYCVKDGKLYLHSNPSSSGSSSSGAPSLSGQLVLSMQ